MKKAVLGGSIALTIIVLMVIGASPVVAGTVQQATETPTPTPTPTMDPEIEQLLGSGAALEPYDYDPTVTSPLSGVSITFSTIWSAIKSAYTIYVVAGTSNAFPIIITVIIASLALGLVLRLLFNPPET